MGKGKITVTVSQGIATITLNEPQRLNALSPEGRLVRIQTSVSDPTRDLVDYDDFANSLREIDQRDDVVATVWQGTRCGICLSHTRG